MDNSKLNSRKESAFQTKGANTDLQKRSISPIRTTQLVQKLYNGGKMKKKSVEEAEQKKIEKVFGGKGRKGSGKEKEINEEEGGERGGWREGEEVREGKGR